MKTKIYYVLFILQLAVILILAGGQKLNSTAAEHFDFKFKKIISGGNPGGFAKKPDLIDASETVSVTIGDIARKARAANSNSSTSVSSSISISASTNSNSSISLSANGSVQDDYSRLRNALINNKTEEARLIIKNCPGVKKGGSETKGPLLIEYLEVRDADKQIMELLLENGADINESWRGYYPLFLALTRGRCDIAEMLIKRGADINIKDAAENSLLHIVMRACEDVRVVDFFYKYKFDFNVKNIYGQTPLLLMILNNKTAALKYFIDKGADINAAVSDNSTPLEVAILRGYETAAIYLVEKGADIKFKNEYGLTPLHKAAQYGLTDLTAVLLSNNADCNSSTKYGSTPLFFAADSGSLPLVELLIKAGANLNARDSSNATPLMSAINSGKFEIADYLATKYPSTLSVLNINEKNKLLIASVEKGNVEFIEKMIENGAKINAAESSGNKAIHLAVIRANMQTIAALIKFGADINSRNSMGRTALHFAAEAGNQQIIDFLKQSGADFFLSDKSGLTPDAIINQKLKERLVKFEEITSCTDETAFIDGPDKIKLWRSLSFKTYPKLHQAAILKSPDILLWLIQNGADCNVRDNNNKTAIEIAMDNYDLESFDVLIENSAEININSKIFANFILFLIEKGHQNYFFDKIVPARPAAVNTIVNFFDVKHHWYQFPLINYAVLTKDIELLKKLIALDADCNDFSSSYASTMYFAINEIIKIFTNLDGRPDGSFKKPLNIFDDAVGESTKNKISNALWELEDIKKLTTIVNLLAEKGAKINCASTDKIFDLISKSFDFENRQLTEIIFNNLADVNLEFKNLYIFPKKSANEFIYTPLTLAIVENLPSTVKILIKNGADLQSFKNQDKAKFSSYYNKKKIYNPLELSIIELNFNITDILIEGGAKISDDKNENPFHFIVESICDSSFRKIFENGVIETKKLDDIIKHFIDKGYDIKAKNKDGQTPLEIISDWDIACAVVNQRYTIAKGLSREKLHLRYMQIYNSLNEIKSASINAFKKYQ